MCPWHSRTFASGTGIGLGRRCNAAAISAPVMPPHTRHSAVELDPSRLAPWRDTHAASPATQTPGLTTRQFDYVRSEPEPTAIAFRFEPFDVEDAAVRAGQVEMQRRPQPQVAPDLPAIDAEDLARLSEDRDDE